LFGAISLVPKALPVRNSCLGTDTSTLRSVEKKKEKKKKKGRVDAYSFPILKTTEA
jgi:hypothetical protein